MRPIARILIAAGLAIYLAACWFAPARSADLVEPVTLTDKRPFNPATAYCNYGQTRRLNVVCYNHDACYSDPTFKRTRFPPATRYQCDRTFLAQCNIVATPPRCSTMYIGIRAGGWTSWARSRANDKRQ